MGPLCRSTSARFCRLGSLFLCEGAIGVVRSTRHLNRRLIQIPWLRFPYPPRFGRQRQTKPPVRNIERLENPCVLSIFLHHLGECFDQLEPTWIAGDFIDNASRCTAAKGSASIKRFPDVRKDLRARSNRTDRQRAGLAALVLLRSRCNYRHQSRELLCRPTKAHAVKARANARLELFKTQGPIRSCGRRRSHSNASCNSDRLLSRRTLLIAVRTEHTTVTRQRAQYSLAARTLEKVDARVQRHRRRRDVSAARAGQAAFSGHQVSGASVGLTKFTVKKRGEPLSPAEIRVIEPGWS